MSTAPHIRAGITNATVRKPCKDARNSSRTGPCCVAFVAIQRVIQPSGRDNAPSNRVYAHPLVLVVVAAASVKKRSRSSCGRGLLWSIALLCVHSRAFALPRLLVLQAEEQPPRPSLLEALRFQLRETVEVQASERPLAPGTAALRIGHATDVVTTAHARFAIWLEGTQDSSGAPGFLLYVVGDRSGRAVVEVVRLAAASDGPDVDRTLALKVSEIVEGALGSDPPSLGSSLRIRAPLPARAPRAAAPRRLPAARRSFAELMVGGVFRGPGGNSNEQEGLQLGLGYAVETSALQFVLGASAQLLTPLTTRRESAEVRIAEQAASADFGLWTRGATQLGARLQGTIRWLHPTSYLGGRQSGSAELLTPALRLAPELRTALGGQASLGLSAGAEWLPVRQRFSLSGVPVADLGQWRVGAAISLIVSIR